MMIKVGFTTFIVISLAVYNTVKSDKGMKITWTTFQENLADVILGLENQIPHEVQRQKVNSEHKFQKITETCIRNIKKIPLLE